MGSSLLQACPTCPVGQTRETVAYLPFGGIQQVQVASGATICRMTNDGATSWEEVRLLSDGALVSYDATVLTDPMPNDSGHNTYRIAARTLDNWGATHFDLWLDCASGQQLQSDVLVRYPDLSKAHLEVQKVTVPWISGQTGLANAFGALRSTEQTTPYGVCITNTAGAKVVVNLQYYLPDLQCVAQKPVPTWPMPNIQCTKPAPIPPPRTCSGQISDGSLWGVPTTDPSTGCGDLVAVSANSLSEAQGCITNLGGSTPAALCEFEVLLYSDAASVYVYKLAQDQANAVACANATECSSCSPVVTAQGGCVGAAQLAR
ncbi:MAG: hypothetical protein U1E65_30165 [Myxococcota bacterium]